jgi:alpha-D-xyloside xylohydrolase
VIEGPVTFTRNYPLEQYPLFIREGAIIPVKVSRSYTGLGDTASADYLTLLIWPSGKSSFDIYREGGEQKTSVQVTKKDSIVTIALTGEKRPHILRIHLPKKPGKILLDGKEITDLVSYNEKLQKLIIKTAHYSKGVYTIIMTP